MPGLFERSILFVRRKQPALPAFIDVSWSTWRCLLDSVNYSNEAISPSNRVSIPCNCASSFSFSFLIQFKKFTVRRRL